MQHDSTEGHLIRGIGLWQATALNMIDMIGVGPFITITLGTFLAMGAVAFAVFLLYRRITIIGKLASFLWVGVIGSALWIIVSGLTHFSARQAFTFPPGAWTLSRDFFLGLGAALLIAVYDYWGYYNVCYLGAEVRDPARTIPRAILLSIAGVAVIYLTMNISILGAMPRQEVQASTFIASDFMQRIWGVWVARIITVLMIWTAFASVFSLILGYSRVPYAAALEGNYFKAFAKVHPKHGFPHVSLLTLGGVAMCFCLFKLADVVTALVVIRVMVQFLAQTLGIIVLRSSRPGLPRPFRMWLYPFPAILAFCGFVYLLVMRPKSIESIRVAIALIVIGGILFALWRVAAKRLGTG